MEENDKMLNLIIEESKLTPVEGIRLIEICNSKSLWLWSGNKMIVYENLLFLNSDGHEFVDRRPICREKLGLSGNEIILDCRVVDIFHCSGDCVFVMDKSGVIHSFQSSQSSSPMNDKEVDDLFGSPQSSNSIYKWKDSVVKKISCDIVINVCQLTAGIAVLVVKHMCLQVLVYSCPGFKFSFLIDLQRYNCKEAVMSSCAIETLSPFLKQQFQDNIDVVDTDITVIGLSSGLLLWFCANNPDNGTFVLLSVHDQIHKIDWVKDKQTGFLTHILIFISLGPVIIFGQEKTTTLFLPDCVKISWSSGNSLITSNLVDTYLHKLLHDTIITVNSTCLPIKGVSAVAGVFNSDTLILVATVHGSVYCMNLTMELPKDKFKFTFPDQSLLDMMFTQTQRMENIYQHLNEEDGILKALSAARAANSIPNLFSVSIDVISDNELLLIVKLSKSGFIFSSNHWTACIEVSNKLCTREISLMNFTQDFSSENDLRLTVKHKLSIGSVVSIELILFLEDQRPLQVIPIDKNEIDACHLMTTQILDHTPSNQEIMFYDVVCYLNDKQQKQASQDFKLSFGLPKHLNSSPLQDILRDSKFRMSLDEWNKISGSKTTNVQVYISNIPVMIHLKIDSREIILISCNIPLCYQVKKAILKRLETRLDSKKISENLSLDSQGLYQTFEIESLKNKVDFQLLEALKNKLRSTISSKI